MDTKQAAHVKISKSLRFPHISNNYSLELDAMNDHSQHDYDSHDACGERHAIHGRELTMVHGKYVRGYRTRAKMH